MFNIIGAGAVGSSLMAYLVAAGHEVRLYARSKDEPTFAACDSVRVQTVKGGQVRVARPALTASLLNNDCPVLVLATKFAALDALIQQLRDEGAGDGADWCLLSTLNGISSLPKLRRAFPAAQVLPLTIMFNAQLTAPLQTTLTTKPRVVLGGGGSAVALLQALKRTELTVQSAAGEQAVYGKLLINLGNALGTLTHSTFRDLFSDPALRRAQVAVMDEAVACFEQNQRAWRLPAPLPYAVYRSLLLHGGPLPWWMAKINNGLGDGAYPSMVSDFRQGKPTEIDQLNGEILRLAAATGGSAPVNAAVVELLRGRTASQAPMSAEQLLQRLPITA